MIGGFSVSSLKPVTMGRSQLHITQIVMQFAEIFCWIGVEGINGFYASVSPLRYCLRSFFACLKKRVLRCLFARCRRRG